MLKRIGALPIAVFMVFCFVQAAGANLTVIGSVDPATGFPEFVQDQANVQLGPCDRVDPVAEGDETINNFPCGGLELDNPFGLFEDGNIAEFTYYRAEANMEADSGERFRLRMEVQGGVLPPASINNGVRLRLRSLEQPGTYTVTTPFSVFEIEVAEGDLDSGIDEELVGALGLDPGFAAALSGPLMCFWPNGTQTVVDGETFLGDGITEQPLTPVGACSQTAAELIFRVDGPFGSVETSLFAVEGKLLGAPGVIVERATYERNGNGNLSRVDVWATSIPLQQIEASGIGTSSRIMIEDGANPGNYYVRQRITPAGSAIPETINVGGVDVPLVDEVTITRARLNVNNDTLEIRAISSDAFGAPELTAFDQHGNELGTLTDGTLTISSILVPPDAPPIAIRVESSAGGSDTEPVDVRGGNVFD